ncbi:hypothetical protein FRC11_012707, partial [Ceratobasidium sp. 423]
MPATDDSADNTSSSSPVLSFTHSADSMTSSDESSTDNKLGEACTPTRARRYPAHLSHGSPRKPSVNSNQYETMEDLLAAAGYAVTRVFTPETERTQKPQEQAKEEHKEGEGSRNRDKLRTHLMSRALSGHPHAQDTQRTTTTAQSQPALRHATSAPSLPRAASGRRRGLPSAWREQATQPPNNTTQPLQTAWSGGFVSKQTEVQLKSPGGKSWFGTVSSDSTARVW